MKLTAKELPMSEEKSDLPDPLKETIVRVLAKHRRHPIPYDKLLKEIARELESQKESKVDAALRELAEDKRILVFGDGRRAEVFLAANLAQVASRLEKVVGKHHTKYPYEEGIRASDIRKSFSETETQNLQRNIDARLFKMALSRCVEEGDLVETEGGFCLSGFMPQKRGDEEFGRLSDAILEYIIARLFCRVDLETMSAHLGIEKRKTKAVIFGMLKSGRLVEIEENRFFEPAEIARQKLSVGAALERTPRLHITEIAASLGQSRTSVRPLLDYFDRIGFTRRVGDFRELVPPRPAGAAS
jgi:hypothetical protein